MIFFNRLARAMLQIYYIYFIKLKNIKVSFNNLDSDYIIWAPHFFSFRFFRLDHFPYVMALYKALKLRKKKVTIYTRKDIGRFKNRNIFVIPMIFHNEYRFENHSKIVQWIVEELQNQNNKVFPNLYEIKFWENKKFMYEQFEKLKIKTPKTRFVFKSSDFDNIDIQPPFLLKEFHSRSSEGLYKVKNIEEAKKVFKKLNLSGGIAVQELLNIRKDLRVIVVGDEIVLFYWRVNDSINWKPTASRFGNKLVFEDFPKQHRELIIEQLKKLKLNIGAFDIAWQNDNVNNQPYFLEVSPYFWPNPKPSYAHSIAYSEWKKSIFLKENYIFKFCDITFDIQSKYISLILLNQ